MMISRAGLASLALFSGVLAIAGDARAQCTPTDPLCNDPAWLSDPCGQQELDAALDPDTTSFCNTSCSAAWPSPALADCQNESWRGSVCGQLAKAACDTVLAANTCLGSPQGCEDPGIFAGSCAQQELDAVMDPTVLGYCESVVCPTAVGARQSAALAYASKCENDQWVQETVCGRRELALSTSQAPASSHPSRCTELGALYGGRWAPVPQVEVVYTEDIMHNPGQTADHPPYQVGDRIMVAKPDYDPAGMQVAPATHSYYANQRARGTAIMSVPSRNLVVHHDWMTKHQGWDDNDGSIPGSMIESCAEYIYEKYYSYSKFEDATMLIGGDYRGIFNVAYGQGESALGTNAQNGIPQHQKFGNPDPRPNNPQITFPSEPRPKNIYYSRPILYDADDPVLTDLIARWEAEDPESRPIRPVNWFRLMILDDELRDQLVYGQEHQTYAESWDWHEQMSYELTRSHGVGRPRYLDEELYAYEAKTEPFKALLARRDETAGRILQIVWDDVFANDLTLTPQQHTGFNPKEIFGQTPLYEQFRGGFANRKATGRVPIAGKNMARTTRFKAAGMSVTPDVSLSNIDVVQNIATQLQPTLEASRQALSRLRPAEVLSECHRLDLADSLKIACLERDLAEIEAAIEAELLHARDDLGCIDTQMSTPCDWNPKYFVQRVGDPYGDVREKEFQRCMDRTAALGFSHLDNPDFSIDSSGDVPQVYSPEEIRWVDCSQMDYRGSPQLVETYFKCQAAWIQQVVAAFADLDSDGKVLDDADRVVVDASSGDHQYLGNSDWNVTQDFAAGWGLSHFPDFPDGGPIDWCELWPSLHSHYTLGATAMGYHRDVINQSVDVVSGSGVNKSAAFLEILGKSIFTPNATATMSDHKFSVISAKKSKFEELFRYDTTVVIVYVPVSVSVGLAGGWGGAARVEADTTECDSGNIRLSGSVGPFLFLNAFATASIDAAIVEVGLKVTLTIVFVSLPLNASLQIRGHPGTGQLTEADVSMKANLKLRLELLSGRVSGFVEVCFIACETLEATIFSWNGIKEDLTLFSVEENGLPLLPLATYQKIKTGGG